MTGGLGTRFTRLVGVRLPVVQTGMGWVSGASLTAATSAAGGLGVLAGVTLDRPSLAAAIRRVRERTDAPFGVNLRPDQPDLPERIRDLVDARVTLVSFAGAPDASTVGRLHDAGILVMPTVGARRHAEKMVALGVDALIAQGAEGGGHTGDVPTSLLLPAVIDAAGDVPVLAAGGFHDGRGLAAALTWGADGVAMGTRFLLTSESRVPAIVKERYLAASPADTMVTRALDGAPQRVLRTPFVDRLERRHPLRRALAAARAAAAFRTLTGGRWSDLLQEGWRMRRNQDRSWSQVLLAANTPMMIRAALVDGDPEAGILPSGQVAGVITDVPTVAELLTSIESDAAAALERSRCMTTNQGG